MSIQMDDLANLDMLEDEYKEEEKKDDWQQNALNDILSAHGAKTLEKSFIVSQFEQMFQKMRQWGSSHRCINMLKSTLMRYVPDSIT